MVRRKGFIEELEKAGHPTEGADILLGLLENTLGEYHKALALIETSQL